MSIVKVYAKPCIPIYIVPLMIKPFLSFVIDDHTDQEVEADVGKMISYFYFVTRLNHRIFRYVVKRGDFIFGCKGENRC